ETAAAEVAGEAVGSMKSGYDAESGKLGLLGAGQDGDLVGEDAFGLSDEFRTVLGVARRRRGDDLDMPCTELLHQRPEPPQRAKRALNRIGSEPTGRGDVTPEAAQYLLVEQRRRRPPCVFINDEADRVRPDVDHRYRA